MNLGSVFSPKVLDWVSKAQSLKSETEVPTKNCCGVIMLLVSLLCRELLRMNDVYCQNVDDDDNDDGDDDDDEEDDDEDDKLAFCLDDRPLNELSTLQCIEGLATFLQQCTIYHCTLQCHALHCVLTTVYQSAMPCNA